MVEPASCIPDNCVDKLEISDLPGLTSDRGWENVLDGAVAGSICNSHTSMQAYLHRLEYNQLIRHDSQVSR